VRGRGDDVGFSQQGDLVGRLGYAAGFYGGLEQVDVVGSVLEEGNVIGYLRGDGVDCG
jgi:hypothetical protein